VIIAFALGLAAIHELTALTDDELLLGDAAALGFPRELLSPLLLPVRGRGAAVIGWAIPLTAGFWAVHAASDFKHIYMNGRAIFRGKRAQWLDLGLIVMERLLPLLAMGTFAVWRAHKAANNAELLGLGFADLIAGVLLCALLPGLMERVRWMVLAMDAESQGTWEHRLLDYAVVMNGLVCRVFACPWLLVLHDRHTRGGLPEGQFEDDVSFLNALVSGLRQLPLKCSFGAVVFFAAGVFYLWTDILLALKHGGSSHGSYKSGGRSVPARNVRDGNNSSSDGESSVAGGTSHPSLRSVPTLESGSLLDAPSGAEHLPQRSVPRRRPNASSHQQNRHPKDDDTELPPALAKRATSQEDLEWLRAQRRIAAQVKAEELQRAAEVRDEGFDEDDSGDDGPLEPIPGYYKKDT